MTTWIPTCALNLWGHPSLECPSFSRAMHAIYPWNVTLMGLSSSSGFILVLRLNALFTPHAWAPRDLGFSLLVTSVSSEIYLSWPSSTVWLADVRGHVSTFWWLTPEHSSTLWAYRLRGTLDVPLVGPSLRDPWPLLDILGVPSARHWLMLLVRPNLRGPTSTSSQRRPRTGRYTSPPVSSC